MSKKDEKGLKEEEVNEIEDSDDTNDSEIENLKNKLEESESNYKRALADYQNLQKRVAEQRSELILSANRDLLLRILSVLDTLVLANKHIENEGLKVSINQFLDVLKSESVTRIETEGKEFDPHLMECVAIDEGEENKVLEELRVGYMLNDKVLRPAQVKVGSAKQNEESGSMN